MKSRLSDGLGGKSIKETLNNYNSIAIYGIGYFGKRLVKLLETEGIIIKFLIVKQ